MLAIATVLVALILSLVITKIATFALAVTGMSRESARRRLEAVEAADR